MSLPVDPLRLQFHRFHIAISTHLKYIRQNEDRDNTVIREQFTPKQPNRRGSFVERLAQTIIVIHKRRFKLFLVLNAMLRLILANVSVP